MDWTEIIISIATIVLFIMNHLRKKEVRALPEEISRLDNTLKDTRATLALYNGPSLICKEYPKENESFSAKYAIRTCYMPREVTEAISKLEQANKHLTEEKNSLLYRVQALENKPVVIQKSGKELIAEAIGLVTEKKEPEHTTVLNTTYESANTRTQEDKTPKLDTIWIGKHNKKKVRITPSYLGTPRVAYAPTDGITTWMAWGRDTTVEEFLKEFEPEDRAPTNINQPIPDIKELIKLLSTEYLNREFVPYFSNAIGILKQGPRKGSIYYKCDSSGNRWVDIYGISNFIGKATSVQQIKELIKDVVQD